MRSSLFLATALASLAAPAFAIVVTDADAVSSVSIPAATDVTNPELSGMVLKDLLLPFSLSDGFGNEISGNIQSRVIKSNVTGSLVFSTRVRDIIADEFVESYNIEGFFLNSYAGFSTDVFYRTDALGTTAPLVVDRTNDPDFDITNNTAPTLSVAFDDFRFATPISDSSLPFSVLTDAFAYNSNGSGQIFGTVNAEFDSYNFSGLAQPSPVPLPPSLATLGFGLFALAAYGRKRRQTT